MSDSRAIASQAWIEVSFAPDPGFKLIFDGMRGHEELGRPFLFDVDLSSGTLQANIAKLVGTSCTIWLAQSDEHTTDQHLNGIVTRVLSSGLVGGAYRYRVEVRPWIWLLSRVADSKIFQKKKAFDIITQIFRDAKFSDFEDKRQSSSGDTELEYCVQYRETSLDFVTRLMEQFGIYYYFEHSDGHHKLILVDDPNCHTALTKAVPFVFDQTEFRTVADHIWEWALDLGLHSGKFTFRDYNFTTPAADLTAKSVKDPKHPYGALEVYDYPGPYETAAIGQKLSDVRMQAITASRTIFDAASNARGLHAGWRFTLSDHPDKATNRKYLITASDFSLSLAEGSSTIDGETIDSYRVALRAIADDVPFRLERLTPRPVIRGPQTAVVVGASGEEIDTDEYGRVKVKFHWDRSDTPDDQRSCWIRVAQPSAGNAWGSMFIPRVGQEVVVEFLEGNPDRPLITGVVYNANMKVPYALPANKTRSTIKSNSSKGGGGSNEIRFEDKKGEEEIFVHAQFDYNKEVLNNETAKIKKDTTTTVEEGNRAVTVAKGNDTHKVDTGNREATVKGNDKTTVSSGNHSIDVSAGKSDITAATSITLTVGGNSIKIDTSGITINGIKIAATASATMDLDGGGMLTAKGGMIKLN